MSEAPKEGHGTNEPPPIIASPAMETTTMPGMKSQQQRKVNSFPHLHAAQLGQDLLLANQFDRNMTVEKAHFEAPPSTQQEDDAGLSSSTDGVSVKRSTKKKSTKRRARPPPAPRTASPAEVFHHNLIDAVLNVDESVENERYIYPFHNAHRFNTMPPVSYGAVGPRPNSHNTRPKLRSHIVDHRPPRMMPLSAPVNGKSSILSFGGGSDNGGGGGYLTDDYEDTLLLDTKHSSSRQQFCNSLVLNLCAGLVLFILATLFISVYRATPLTNLSINMGRVLASDKELIFDLHAYASNWNWWTVRIPEADISVFAFTQPLSLDDNGTTIHDPAEFLGSVNRFDEPLAFYPSLLIDGPSSAITQIRIKSPGADKSGNENWSKIIRNPYGLIVRGVFKYNMIPFAKLYSQSVPIYAAVDVDPVTDRVSATSGQSPTLSSPNHSLETS
ncbi:hypothetical protein VTP01DRAFT_4575 [Rhizomucor pusillus]|uniref:uncharacterized protein n=1 Tax=Rhizomucor pusillus TaxID=4840 RepID=UPI00374440F1